MFYSMRLILIVIVVAIEALGRVLFPHANRRSRFAFEEPRRSDPKADHYGSGVPVVPNRPLDMAGGAAALMYFDE